MPTILGILNSMCFGLLSFCQINWKTMLVSISNCMISSLYYFKMCLVTFVVCFWEWFFPSGLYSHICTKFLRVVLTIWWAIFLLITTKCGATWSKNPWNNSLQYQFVYLLKVSFPSFLGGWVFWNCQRLSIWHVVHPHCKLCNLTFSQDLQVVDNLQNMPRWKAFPKSKHNNESE